ncbi:MAG: chemotaxis response regulator protein-glutamate methylesterase [Armatimonadetes bacterium]|nr:chemotaxis response regulator protein-glutamate methylesterase [Armatimonadota bacterium]
MPRLIRVLIADDSAFMRRIITDILAEDPQIEVAAVARDGQEALEKARETRPDVITLDIEMPRMDGIAALSAIMKERPVPVVMISTLTREGTEATLRCLELGAVDFIPKPTGLLSPEAARMKEQLVIKIKTAAVARLLASLNAPKPAAPAPSPPRSVPAPRPSVGKGHMRLVVIGTSTGGPRALQEVIPRLPGDLKAAVAVVQHMPAGFTRSLADRLNSLSSLYVKEAEAGDALEPGKALLAPGGWHMAVESGQAVSLNQDPPLWGVRPSVDVTLKSAAAVFGRRAVGVILTGMGRDGADGMAAVRQCGGVTIAEHESTCVVYGMPKTVIEAGTAGHIVPLPKIVEAIVEALNVALAA